MKHSLIINESARFTLLTNGLVRMEYSSTGQFEDRVSIRLVKQENAIPFTKVLTVDNQTILTTALFTITYTDDGQAFHRDNLKIVDPNELLIWQPGQVDEKNMGGVHMGMDCIQRKVIPSGVHPATTAFHENSTRFHLWSYIFGNKDQVDPDAHYDGDMLTLEQLITKKSFDDLTPHIQDLLSERKKYPPGVLSTSGYFLYNDSKVPVYSSSFWPQKRTHEQLDYYLFVYGKNFEQGMKDYQKLFGQTPMIPRYSLGLWFSRYPTLNQSETNDIIQTFETHHLPFDVMVLDLEWHQRGWYGFDWDYKHYPKPNEFIGHLKEKQIYTTLNVHPDGVPTADDSFNDFIKHAGIRPSENTLKEEIYHNIDLSRSETATAFMDVFHKPNLDMDVQFWWIDGAANCSLEDVGNQLFTNEVYQRYMVDNYPQVRPMVCSRTEGLGSHRYPFHFTGDTYSQFEVLASQVEYTMRAGHIGQSFITHDIGGHMCKYKHIDSELLCRWYQFGAMSPIFRLHSSGGSERVPWLYDDFALQSLQQAMQFRMTLLPYLYSLVWESHKKGLPMIRSNPLSDPSWHEGYDIWDSYFLGDRIYCTPITQAGDYRSVCLPKGKWYSGFNNTIIDSDGCKEQFLVHKTEQKPPHFYKAGKLIVKQPYQHRASTMPEKLLIEFYIDDEIMIDHYTLYEDDGFSNEFKNDHSHMTTFDIHGHKELLLSIDHDDSSKQVLPKNRCYDIKLIYSKEISIQYIDESGEVVALLQEEDGYYCHTFKDIACQDQKILLRLLS